MNINFVGNISDSDKPLIEEKFQKLFLDLTLREDNHYCGSYLGGNNFQLIALSMLEHVCSDLYTNVSIITDNHNPFNTKVCWGAQFLLNSELKDIRPELDNICKNIPCLVRDYAGAINNNLTDIDSLKKEINKYNDSFPMKSLSYDKLLMQAVVESELPTTEVGSFMFLRLSILT